MRADLLQDKLKQKELLKAQLANIDKEIVSIEEQEAQKKVTVEKDEVGFLLGVATSQGEERLNIHLTEDEAKTLVKDILADVKDFTFVMSPLAEEFNNVLKDFEGIFKGHKLF